MKKRISFANLSIRFGEKELLDYKEVVTRALLRDTHVRKFGRTTYLFLDAQIAYLDRDDPLSLSIFGRFVKSTVLQREQIMVDGRLVRDERDIESAPSAFFVFVLADHRLIYMPETKFAPPISALEATIDLFVKREFNDFIDKYYREVKGRNPKFTRKDAFRDHVPPSVSLIPLASAEGIDDFLRRFAKLDKLTVRLIERNQDMKNGDIFEKLIKKVDPLDPSTAKLEVRGSGDGLDLDEASKFVTETTEGGYEEVTLSGKGAGGEDVSGTNDDFKLQVEVEIPAMADRSIAARLLEVYLEQKEVGNIKVTQRDKEQLAPILAELLGADDEGQ